MSPKKNNPNEVEGFVMVHYRHDPGYGRGIVPEMIADVHRRQGGALIKMADGQEVETIEPPADIFRQIRQVKLWERKKGLSHG